MKNDAQETAMHKLWRLALTDLAVFAADIALLYVGFTMGWGMQVQNWWWFIGVAVIGRWMMWYVIRWRAISGVAKDQP